jgi:uncharacterized membrane protein YdjX (TVP38/TMEM64 family)
MRSGDRYAKENGTGTGGFVADQQGEQHGGEAKAVAPRPGAWTMGLARLPWRYLPLVLVLAGIAAVFATGAHRNFRLENLLDHRDRLQAFVAAHGSRALLLYMAVYIGAVTLSIPVGAALTVLGGFLFGWLVGAAAAAISATLGGIGVFLIARTSIGDALVRRAGNRIQRLAAGFREDAFSYLLFLRFLPFPFWITNLASALFGVPLKTFVLATQIGIIPVTFAFAVAGSGLDSIIASQQQARAACLSAGGSDCGLHLGFRHLLTPQIVAALVLLGLLALAPVAVKRLRRNRRGLDADRPSA